jgi:type II restriction enzyme
MAFEATKREWGELYAFFRLLADGFVSAGRADGQPDPSRRLPVALVQREEHNGTRRYVIERDSVRMECEGQEPRRIPREDFDTVARLVWEAVRTTEGEDVTSPDGVEEFLDELAIYDLAAQTDDRTDFHVALYAEDAPLEGVSVRCMVGRQFPLLDGGRTANFKFEQGGIKFATPTVNKINAFGDTEDVAGRMMMIERLGGTLRFSDAADKVFRSNLCMIDLHFPRMVGEMVRLMQLDGLTRVSELTEAVKALNPLKIKEELITKHGYYEYKMKQFLMAVALGMRPAKLFNGSDSAIQDFIRVDGSGQVVIYRAADRATFAEFLYRNTRFEKGATEKDKYGYLEKENGVYFFKLNLKLGLAKR